MVFEYIDINAPENVERGIEVYSGNDNFFRTKILPHEFAALPRKSFDYFNDKSAYMDWLFDLPYYVFINLKDILKYINVINTAGFETIDIISIADIVCDYHGADYSIAEVLFNTFDEDISSEIHAKLGLEDDGSMLMSAMFDETINVVFEIANVIQRYIVNAKFPIIEYESVYTAEKFERGLLVLRLRHWEEVAETNGY